MMAGFDCTDGGRDYHCTVEERRSSLGTTTWWWFGVQGDRSRYAPFVASTEDTEMSVRSRVVAYYDDLIERRGLPYSRFPLRT